MTAWDETRPLGSSPISSVDDELRNLKAAVRERTNVGHTTLDSMDTVIHKPLFVPGKKGSDAYSLKAGATKFTRIVCPAYDSSTVISRGVGYDSSNNKHFADVDGEKLYLYSRFGTFEVRAFTPTQPTGGRPADASRTFTSLQKGDLIDTTDSGYFRVWPASDSSKRGICVQASVSVTARIPITIFSGGVGGGFWGLVGRLYYTDDLTFTGYGSSGWLYTTTTIQRISGTSKAILTFIAPAFSLIPTRISFHILNESDHTLNIQAEDGAIIEVTPS